MQILPGTGRAPDAPLLVGRLAATWGWAWHLTHAGPGDTARVARVTQVMSTAMRLRYNTAWSRQRIRKNVDHQVGMDINQHQVAICKPVLQMVGQRWQRRN